MKKAKKKITIGILIVSILTMVIILVSFLNKQVTEFFKNASSDNYLAYDGPKYVNIGETNSKSTDGMNEIDKIYLRSSWDSVADKTNTGWCLKKGAGIYGLGYTYKGSGTVNDSIIQSKSNAYGNSNATNSSNANKMKWLFDNMVRFGTGVTADEKNVYRQNLADITGIKEVTDSNKYSDDTIFKAQQYVLWSYTQNDSTTVTGSNNNNLYKKLKEAADKQGGYSGDGSIKEGNNKVKIEKASGYTVTKDGWVGPLKISENNSKSKITFSTLLNSATCTTTVYEENKTTKLDNLNTYNGTFYIKLNKTLEDNKKYTIKFTFDNKAYTTKAWYYTTSHITYDKDGNKYNPQPFLMLEREKKSENITVTAEYENKVDVDLALKKAIVEVKRDGESIYSKYFKDEKNNFLGYKNDDGTIRSRFFQINSSGLDNSSATTAEYKMQKAPIKVKKGDIVIYSITIFNEGNIPAIASEITDYLPEGLELDLDTDLYPVRYGETNYGESSDNGFILEHNNITGADTVKITCLSNKQLISAYDKEKGLMYHSKTVYVRCKVKDDAKGILTNVSEITKYKYQDGDSKKEVTNETDLSKVLSDRDSKVANWKSPNGTREYNVSSNRGNIYWRNYSNDKKVSTSFIDYGAQNKDDDDFEKIEVEEEYKVIVNKVDSSDKNKKLQGVQFGVTINDKSPIRYITNDEGIIELPVVKLDNEGTDIYIFEEINVGDNDGYVKLEDTFELGVRKELKDEINYEITGYYLRRNKESLSRDPYIMGENQIKLKDENGNIVTVKANCNVGDKQINLEITNNKSLGYTLNLEKVDSEDGTELSEAQFTIDGPDGNIQTEQNLPNGKLEIANKNVTLDTNYEYTIEETSAQTNYENIFAGYKIKVNLYVNSVGKIEESRSSVSVIPKEGTTEDSTMLDKALSSVQLFIDDKTNNAKLIIKNDKTVKTMQLSLYKHNNSYGVNGAVFNLYNSDANANQLEKVSTIKTNSQNSLPETQALYSKDGLTIGTTYYYILEEETVPENYVAVFKKALIKVYLGEDKIVKYSVEKVYKNNIWYNYIESDKEVITIDENTGKISLENPIIYNFNLYKKDYVGNKDIKDCEPFGGTVSFKVEQIYPSIDEPIKHNTNLTNAQLNLENIEAKANSTYKYKITETNVSDDYYDTLVNKPIIVTVRTDRDGNIKEESYEGSNWEFDSELNLTEEQILKLSSLIKMHIDGNDINFYIANMPKNYYSLQLIKVDETGKTIETKETEFYISQTSTNPDTEGFFIGTEDKGKPTNKGMLDIVSGLTIESGYTHKYVIKETKEPTGYTKLLGNVEVGVEFTDNGELLDENITCKYIENGLETTLTGLKKVFTNGDIPTIQIYIPNEANLFKFELIKEDFAGNKIQADVLENGNIDGPKFNVSLTNIIATGNTNVPDGINYEDFGGITFNDILKDGVISGNIVAYSNLKYIFRVDEVFAKSGYMNILDGYGLIINVQTNDESKISSVEYQVIDKNDHNKYVTESFKTKYGEYLDIYKDEAEEKVVLRIKNSTGYKVRLSKEDTVNNPITTARVEAYIEESGQYIRKCAINGIYQIEGTKQEYEVTGESSHISEEFIPIKPGETQIWKVYERTVNLPYQNVFDKKYIEVTVQMNDVGVLSVQSYTIKKEDGSDITQEELYNLKNYIKQVNFVKEDGIDILNITLKNPLQFQIKLVKTEADDNYTPLVGATLKVNGEIVIQNGESIYETTYLEVQGHSTKKFEIEEIDSANGHVNILEGKKLIVFADIGYKGNIDRVYYYLQDKTNNKITGANDEIFKKYISIEPINIPEGELGIAALEIKIKNPISFNFELYKVDTKENALTNAKFEIISPIIQEQEGRYFNTVSKVGVDALDSITGTVYGTAYNSRVSFGETYVSTGKTYEYIIKETQTPGAQYVNILEDYELFIKVNVAQDGTISLENYANGRKCMIKNETGEADSKYYEYVDITIENNTVKVKLQNPNRLKVKLNKKLFGEENVDLYNVKFEINSSNSGKKDFITDYNGNIGFEDELINIDTVYEYDIRELEVPGEGVINILDNYYIKVRIKVKSDGTMTTVDSNGVETINTYEIYKLEGDTYTKIEFDNTNIEEYIEIDTSKKENDIPVLDIKVKDPQKYSLKLYKEDIDTNLAMNDVLFNITVLDEEGYEVSLKDANTLNNKDLTNVKTSLINGKNGIIEINNILFEKTGVYTLKIQEQQIDGYKQIPDIYAQVYIELINRKYNITNIEITQGKDFVNSNETQVIDEDDLKLQIVQIGILNERIKGSYDLEISKTDLRENYLDGAKVKLSVIRENRESTLYQANDDVTSKDVIIPTELEITDGKITIENIRIEKPESYIIRIEEIVAPEKFVKLEEPVEIKVSTKVEGEGINTKYVLDSAEIVSGSQNELASIQSSKESLIVSLKNEQFDLALRKFATKVITNEGKDNERVQDLSNRVPTSNTEYLQDGTQYTAIYNHTKQPVSVYRNDIVIYTIRVYNEGDIAGYAEEVTDYLPEYLEFVNDEFNSKYGWLLDENDKSLRTVKTNCLSKEINAKDNLILSFNKETGEIDYKEIQIKCKVKETAPYRFKLTNLAEITRFIGENGRIVVDRDSKENNISIPHDADLPVYKDDEISKAYVPGQQDDDDFEKIIVEEFDLALRKFITSVTNGYGDKQEVTTRIPVFKVDEQDNYVYEHTKEPLLVGNENIVEYTIRVYNEGSVDGYASKIKDDIPEGLEFLPDEELNKEYRWIMLDEEGNETDDVNKAKYITTDYLSKEQEKVARENLLKAFDKESYEVGLIKEPDYKEVKVAFKVTMPNTSDEIIINQAQISDDSDKDGNEVTDKDSTPNEWVEGEDDQDIEKIKVQYFDLALRKWVTKAIVIENGQETVHETGHKAEDDPEEVVKVDLKKSKLDKVVVKFEYQIRVTNEGKIAGSVEEISDYIPEGLKFVAADNPEWEEVEGKVVTDQLAGQIMQPGESKEVTILLTWINREDNMGLKVNVAEISKDYNEYGSPDIDSTPNNKVPGEDDIDDAPVMLAITTGQTIMYIGMTIAVLVILAGGTYGIKRFVVNK